VFGDESAPHFGIRFGTVARSVDMLFPASRACVSLFVHPHLSCG